MENFAWGKLILIFRRSVCVLDSIHVNELLSESINWLNKIVGKMVAATVVHQVVRDVLSALKVRQTNVIVICVSGSIF